MSLFDLIPEGRRDAAREAVRTVSGARSLGAAHPISGGVSGALIVRFEVDGRRFVLRVEPDRVALQDRTRGYACMTAAAAQGAAPGVHHADPVTGVAIMDFVSGQPLSTYPGGPAALVKALGALIAKVQGAGPFPSFGDFPSTIGRLLTSLADSPLVALDRLAPYAEGLERIRSALTWDAASMVSSHNDPNPRNLLFDGARLWLIDWELAFRNDPLVDVAILSTEFAPTPELEDVLLAATFGAAPDRGLRARLHIIRLLTRLFYGCIVLDSLREAPRSTLGADDVALTPDGFREAVADGRRA
jgi:aminoglycoside phosphotransferase (APT) family kinase protein